MKISIKRFTKAVLLAGCILTPAFAYESITTIQVPGDVAISGSTGRIIDSVIEVTSLTTDSGTYSGFIGPTEGFKDGGVVSFATRGFNDNGNTPDFTPTENLLLGNNLARTLVNGSGLFYNLMFGQTITDDNVGADTNFEVFYFELLPGNEAYSLQAIIGGTAAVPVLGGSAVTVSSTVYAPISDIVSSSSDAALDRSDSSSVLDANYGGQAFDLSEFGVTSLVGIRFVSTNSADPAAILVIPEPSTLALFAGALVLFGLSAVRKRR